MATLKLTLATGLAWSIPSNCVRTIEGVLPGRFSDAPKAGCVVRVLIGNQLRTRVLNDAHAAVRALLTADRAARQDWLDVETSDGQPFSFLPTDVAAVEDLDPEADRSKGCTALVDLEIAGVAVTELYCKADPAEVRAASEPPEPGDVAAKPSNRVRPARKSSRR